MDSHVKFPTLQECRPGDTMKPLELPLTSDEPISMKMVFQKCTSCKHQRTSSKNGGNRITKMCRDMSPEEIGRALQVKSTDLLNQLPHAVPCVGCRNSVEKLFTHLVQWQHPAIEPLIILPTSELTLKSSFFTDPGALCQLFNTHGMDIIAESVLKNKKNKRCMLHSLETHKSRTTGVCHSVWMEVWEAMSEKCRKNFTQIDLDGFSATLDSYLRKHRFCTECKSKVQLAYSILIGERDSSKEKSYSQELYEKVEACPEHKHIHVDTDTEYIASLITKAEPELFGNSRRDRHAKTLDIAQEEVLTCLGVHLYERLHCLWLKVKTQNQTWTILFNLGVDCLKKSFMMAQEQKRGISNLELTCQAMMEEERQREHKLEMKRLKKKKKKSRNAENENMAAEEQSVCQQHSSSNGQPLQTWHSNCENKVCGVEETKWASCENFHGGEKASSGHLPPHLNVDFGYASGPDACESCSMPSSNEGSEIACSDSICVHDGDGCWDGPESSDLCLEGHTCSKWQSRDLDNCSSQQCTDCSNKGQTRGSTGLNLLKYYQKICHCPLEDEREKDGDSISEEDIRQFKEANSQHQHQRQALREKLRQRFQDLQEKNSRAQAFSHSVLS